ncbi:hypothetical protein CR203_06435 [Salipaludibacillus neizhouensis]|uniref:DUF624 domain-containing protein n=1 Tax=Salipaludibacillus neizhouensis TaxID=885475 RepID=A0A3A9KEQ9_9BACI|nr:DUF624 domain-containing protein [Salipaludibacillus neizhouensis]RKL68123.1 hypothetical protein CR203_06435 [Salipaludibacillus neizhouensis]
MESFAIERIYRVADMITRIAYINLLMIVFTLIGFVVFGFFPAIIAGFWIFRKWFNGYSDIAITKNFWKVYKQEFFKSNLLGLIILFIGSILFINLSIAEVIQNEWIRLTYYPLLLISILFVATLIYLLPMYVQFKMKIGSLFKNAFLCLFVNPFVTIILLALVTLIYLLFTIIPGLIPFFGFSLFLLVMMKGSLIVFDRVVVS